MRKSLRTTIPAIAAAVALTLAGCGQGTSPDPTNSPTPTTTAASQHADPKEATAAGFALVDGWAKAIDSLDGEHPMTGIFGTLTNTTDADIRLSGGHSPAAGIVELHETVMSGGAMVMREAAEGFVIPAGESLVLEPGGNHIMLMGLTAPIPAGTDVLVTVTTTDGTEFEFTVPARTFAGAEETYAPGHGAPGEHPSEAGTASS